LGSDIGLDTNPLEMALLMQPHLRRSQLDLRKVMRFLSNSGQSGGPLLGVRSTAPISALAHSLRLNEVDMAGGRIVVVLDLRLLARDERSLLRRGRVHI